MRFLFLFLGPCGVSRAQPAQARGHPCDSHARSCLHRLLLLLLLILLVCCILVFGSSSSCSRSCSSISRRRRGRRRNDSSSSSRSSSSSSGSGSSRRSSSGSSSSSHLRVLCSAAGPCGVPRGQPAQARGHARDPHARCGLHRCIRFDDVLADR